MTYHREVVVKRRGPGARLPEWATAGAEVVHWLTERGLWEAAGERLKVQREGGYAGIDAVLVLLAYFAADLHVGVKEFLEQLGPQRALLAAVGGRCHLPTQSSMSRLLRAVDEETAADFGDWLLQQAPGVEAVLHHPSVMHHDAMGVGWHVFDWDPTVTTLRHRALPQFEGTPDARRRSESLAAPGYPGRKRGDVQFSRGTLQHAGSGLWFGIDVAAGSREQREMFERAVGQVVATCNHAQLDGAHVVLRSDGAGGNVPFITACMEAGLQFLTRIAHYQVLDDPDVIAHLNASTWYDVPSSGSGPRRQACDVGSVQLEPSAGTTRSDGTRYPPIWTRVVVSRFPSRTEAGRGAGVVVDGWQYELYATNLEPDGWPEAEVVAGYYGRTAQENRFHQEDRELGLDRIFSYHLPGQQLASAIGLFIWNFRICRGMELLVPPTDAPEPPRSEVTPVVERIVLAQVEPPTVEPHAEAPDDDGLGSEHPEHAPTASTGARRDFFDEVNRLDVGTLLAHLPGWSWMAEHEALRCANHTLLPLSSVGKKNDKIHLRFFAPAAACGSCEKRHRCMRSDNPNVGKDIRLAVPDAVAESIHERWLDIPLAQRPRARSRPAHLTRAPIRSPHPRASRRTKRLDRSPPPLPATRPELGLAAPTLMPAELRKATRRASQHVEIRVRLSTSNASTQLHPAIAPTAARRQKRRLSWADRLRWNALPDDSSVRIEMTNRNPLGDPSPVSKSRQTA
jgi:hypothetical protein